MLFVGSVAASVGLLTLTISSAATFVASSEAEDGLPGGSAAVASVPGQSASGAVRFGSTPTGQFQANCIVSPHVCGYPDETNTGVPAGTVLADSGSITVTQDGAVIEKLNVTGSITVNANNVTIRKTRITSGDYYPIRYDSPRTGLVVEDTEIAGTSPNVTAAISFANYTARRVNAHGAADGMKADDNVTIEDSYIHDLAVNESTHNDGIQTTGGGSNVVIRHNTIKLSTTEGASACMQMGNEWGINTGWLVTGNLLDGGGWCINSGDADTNMTYSNNRFTRNAGYGPGVVSGSTWTGNYFDDDGTPVN